MKFKHPSIFLECFPDAHYHADVRLLTWHAAGTLDDALADEIIFVLQTEESFENVPFNRFTDFSLLTSIHLRIGHVFEIAMQRREVSEPVRSAFFADTTVAFGIARMYESLMQGAVIQVRAFRDRDAAAAWLGVPVQLLLPE